MLPRLSKSSSTRASFRTIIVPAANIGSNLGPWLVIIGIMLMGMGKALGQSLAVVGVVLFALATLFTLLHVPRRR